MNVIGHHGTLWDIMGLFTNRNKKKKTPEGVFEKYVIYELH